MCDISFKCGNTSISRDSSELELMTATAATLRPGNQKNGIRGSLIHRSTCGGNHCPVRALVKRFLHLRDNGAEQDTLISTYWDHLGKTQVTDDDMRVAIRYAAVNSV